MLLLFSPFTVFLLRRIASTRCIRCIVSTDGVAWSVCMCVCLLVTFVSLAKTAEPIEMPFWGLTPVGPTNHGQHRTNQFAVAKGDKLAMRPFAR